MYSLNSSLFIDNYREIISSLTPRDGLTFLSGDYVFTSFHVKEHLQGDYKCEMKELCAFAKKSGKKRAIIGRNKSVSKLVGVS